MRIAPLGLDTSEFSGEQSLVIAILQQALEDARSPYEDRQREACQFLQDRSAVTFWTELIDIDGNVFLTLAEHYLGPQTEDTRPA